jgi:hypothetical protein
MPTKPNRMTLLFLIRFFVGDSAFAISGKPILANAALPTAAVESFIKFRRE